MARENPFPGMVVAAAVPSLALIVTKHASLGAVLFGAAIAAWVAYAGLTVRADRQWEIRLLDYAQTATSLGGDPTGVLRVLRPHPDTAVEVDPDAGLFRPDEEDDYDGRPWVHLPASDR
jgi:hypothetical protein